MPADPSHPESWRGADKLAIIIKTATLNDVELSEYCRQRFLVVEQTHLSQKQRGTAELLGQLNMGQWPRHRSINRTVGPAAE